MKIRGACYVIMLIIVMSMMFAACAIGVDSIEAAQAQYNTGCNYKSAGELYSAIQAFDNVIKNYPDNAQWCSAAMLMKADCQREFEAYGAAVQTYQAIIATYANMRDVYVKAKLGFVRTVIEGNRIGGKINMWRTIDKISVEQLLDADIRAYGEFLKSRYVSNELPDFDEAELMFQAYMLDDGKPVDIVGMSCADLDSLAEQYFLKGNYARAQAIYNAFCKNCSDNEAESNALLNIGICYIKLRNYTQARETLSEVVSKYSDDPISADAQNSIAESYVAENKLPEAIAAYDAVKANTSSDAARCANAMLAKGRLQRKLTKYADSVNTFQSLINTYPDQDAAIDAARRELVEALASNKQYDEAMGIIAQMISNSSSSSSKEKADLLYWKAGVQNVSSRFSDCCRTLKDILSSYPDQKAICLKAEVMLGSSLLMTGNGDEAIEVLNRVAVDENHSHGDHARVLLWKGIMLRGRDVDGAIESLGKVISDYGDTPICHQAYLHRALLLIQKGAYTKASSDIEKIQTPCWKYFAEGECFFAQNKYTEAIASYSKVYDTYQVNEMPLDVPFGALLKLKVCYESTGNSDKIPEVDKQINELIEKSK